MLFCSRMIMKDAIQLHFQFGRRDTARRVVWGNLGTSGLFFVMQPVVHGGRESFYIILVAFYEAVVFSTFILTCDASDDTGNRKVRLLDPIEEFLSFNQIETTCLSEYELKNEAFKFGICDCRRYDRERTVQIGAHRSSGNHAKHRRDRRCGLLKRRASKLKWSTSQV